MSEAQLFACCRLPVASCRLLAHLLAEEAINRLCERLKDPECVTQGNLLPIECSNALAQQVCGGEHNLRRHVVCSELPLGGCHRTADIHDDAQIHITSALYSDILQVRHHCTSWN